MTVLLLSLWISPALAAEKPKASPLQRMMQGLQLLVEVYAIDYAGIYPPNVSALYRHAQKQKVWFDSGEFKFEGRVGVLSSIPMLFLDASPAGETQGVATLAQAPLGVIYYRIEDGHYCIFSYASDGKLLSDTSGESWVLTDFESKDKALCRLP
ncbi:MAG: hypothetical protein CVV27_03210 [Candidatus Melainabacteria bacterium HGW-Melainabacteria-1]|nr:MAG: hypothetical protein CVV27_03210 [Candidatus Melainabacteria bacterium HGW-Melainabacteria-1]